MSWRIRFSSRHSLGFISLCAEKTLVSDEHQAALWPTREAAVAWYLRYGNGLIVDDPAQLSISKSTAYLEEVP